MFPPKQIALRLSNLLILILFAPIIGIVFILISLFVDSIRKK